MKKDKLFDIICRIVYPTALYFTVVTLLLYIIGAAVSDGASNMIPTLRTILIIFGFSLVFNLANMILTAKKLHISLRITLHFVITALAFYILFINASDYNVNGSFTIVLLLIYTVVYAAICAVVLAVRSASRKTKIESSEYRPIYDKRI